MQRPLSTMMIAMIAGSLAALALACCLTITMSAPSPSLQPLEPMPAGHDVKVPSPKQKPPAAPACDKELDGVFLVLYHPEHGIGDPPCWCRSGIWQNAKDGGPCPYLLRSDK